MQNVVEEEGDESTLKVWEEFQAENLELNELMKQTEEHQASRDVAKKDDIASKLYKIKQTKKK